MLVTTYDIVNAVIVMAIAMALASHVRPSQQTKVQLNTHTRRQY